MRKLVATAVIAFVSLWALSASAVPIFNNASLSNSSYTVNIQQNLQVGDTVYSDRTYTFNTIPAPLIGLEWLQTANDAKDGRTTLTFDVLVDATVFLWIDDRMNVTSAMPWVATDGWASTGLSVLIVDNLPFPPTSYSIYSMTVGAGSTITTGTQNGNSFYGLAAVAVPEPASLGLFGIGLVGLGFAARRRKRR